jgi:glucosamine-6-phosphate deaminase
MGSGFRRDIGQRERSPWCSNIRQLCQSINQDLWAKGMFMNIVDTDVKHLRVGTLKLEVHPNRNAAGAAAAQAAAVALKELALDRSSIGVIFATGASQLDMLEALVEIEGLPWERIRGFHMDEYIGIDPEHPASFRRYLRERLTQKVRMQEFSDVNGSASDPKQTARDYATKLASANPQLCFLGIGENGHLAFNDPAVANFEDPLDVKVVQLDTVCRKQQAAEGWFQSLEEVPDAAITITVPALLRVPKLIVSVPGKRKAEIMRRTLEEPISTACPATILRTHPDATVYLDVDSAAELDLARFSGE